MQLNRSQLSFLITFFSMSLVVLGLYSIHLGETLEEEYVIELSLMDDEELEKILEEEQAKAEMTQAHPIKSHLAFNETAKPSLGSPEPLKTLDEILAEKETASESDDAGDSEDTGYAEALRELAKKREEKRKLLGEKEAQKEAPTHNFAKRNTSISYSLVERTHRRLPIPIYTCIEGGKVVINIKVDALGFVTEATANTNSSTTLNGCLVDNAIAYALQSKFDTSDKAIQLGTITYLFQSK
ncbi:hypothetical protein U1E44_13865 [Arenibacter sp. GZD96]|uniref:hypothetical protein n=1 Tax=Aurantibrevibacter litoralis TaxID=3106030 RepID=UPI002AFF6BFD|nr:hypothetical protein [Arenibacter sp. GZD-96]MEA1787183.1 hypothetical protein [Arenibacter sp. GZD-96]